MLKSVVLAFALVCALPQSSLAGTPIVATTTLTQETGNNTSAASSFSTSLNGNVGAGNVSKADLRTLLYAGAKAKIYAHYMAWWGSSSHINIGYDSTNPTQVRNQITDMLSRGINGMIIDWYGPGNANINQSSLAVMRDSETRSGKFEFAIMEDQGSIRTCAYTSGCDASQALINDLTYIVNTFAVSPAYMRIDGRPVIFTFDVENLPNIDWSRVLSTVPGNPKVILHNTGGFRLPYSSGSYAWIPINMQNQSDWGQGYLDNFYATGKTYSAMHPFAGVWKGFDDRAAAWSQNRIVNQNCGQVWLSTFQELNRYYSSSSELQGVQLVTWNDYEEGTAIEMGIDNCVSLTGSVGAGTLSWIVNGQENTIDHYAVFVSADGQNLMPLADVASSARQLSLAGFSPGPGNFTFYVKAVGKPSITNKMSGPIPFSVANLPPTVKFAVTPNSGTAPVSVTASTAGSADPDGAIATTTIDFGDGTVANAITTSHVYGKAGTYTIKAVITDNLGSSTTVASAVTVTAPFTVTAVSPANGATVTGPVRFVATSASQATALRVYVDNISVYTVNAATLDTTLALSPGAHYVVLQGWNAQGVVSKASLNITVVSPVLNPRRVSRSGQPTSVVTLPLTVGAAPAPVATARHSRSLMTVTVDSSDTDADTSDTSVNATRRQRSSLQPAETNTN